VLSEEECSAIESLVGLVQHSGEGLKDVRQIGLHPHALLSAHQLPLSPGNSGHAVRAKNGLDPSDGHWL
jgi:hypothetical protein